MSHFCNAKQLNVYVTYEDGPLKEYIQNFNKFLKKHELFEKYEVQPFITQYSLHTTLYLAHFASSDVPQVIDKVKNMVSKWSQFDIRTTKIEISNSNFVMLNVKSQKPVGMLSSILQIYSDATVFALYQMRDPQAPIPEWAKKNPSKHHAYQRYGSPNVFFEFHPHFTLMAKPFEKEQTMQSFHAEMQSLIEQHEQMHSQKHLTLTATHIGVGYVNQYGQITRELAKFVLRKKGLT